MSESRADSDKKGLGGLSGGLSRTTRFQINGDDRRRAVLEAIGYEITMLVVAGQLIELTKPQPIRQPGPDAVPWMSWGHNAQIESHLIHVRNLFEFFYQHGLEVNARDYIEHWSKLRPSLVDELGVEHKTLHDYLSTRLSHITPERADKVRWPTQSLTSFLFEVVRVFDRHLDPEWRTILRAHTQFIDLSDDPLPP